MDLWSFLSATLQHVINVIFIIEEIYPKICARKCLSGFYIAQHQQNDPIKYQVDAHKYADQDQ